MRFEAFNLLLIGLCVLCESQAAKQKAAEPDTTAIVQLLVNAEKLPNHSESLKLCNEALAKSYKINYARGVIRSLNQIGQLYQAENKYDSSIHFYSQAAKLSTTTGLAMERSVAMQGMGESYMRLHKGDSSRKYLMQALGISRQSGNKGFEAGIFNNLANTYLNENRYEEALDYFIISANLYDSLNNMQGFSKALSNIGNVEYRLGHFEKATDYARQSIKLASTSNHESGVAYGHKLLGWIYRKQGKLNEALLEYDSAKQKYTQLGIKRDIAEIALSMGNARYDKGEFERAILHYKEALLSCQQSDYIPFIPYCYSGLAFSFHSLKNYKLAGLYADSLVQTARSINVNLLMDGYELKSSIHEAQKDFEKALLYEKKHQIIKDSLTEVQNRQAMEEAAAKYQADLKQKEIDQLRQDMKLQDTELQHSRIIQFGIGLAFLLGLVIAFMIFNRIQIINRANRQLEIERMRNAIALDLHDDIGSALSSINISSQLALNENPSEPSAPVFKRINDQAVRVLERMSDIVWSINAENDGIEKVISKMKEFAAEILESKNIEFDFTIGKDLKGLMLDSEKRKNFFLVYKEAINNAAKYSMARHVQVALFRNGSHLNLQITDNGKGFSLDQIRKGNGLKNMEHRANTLGGKLDIQSSPGMGTRLELSIPIT